MELSISTVQVYDEMPIGIRYVHCFSPVIVYGRINRITTQVPIIISYCVRSDCQNLCKINQTQFS